MRVLIKAGLLPVMVLSAMLLAAMLGPLAPVSAASDGSGHCYPVGLTWICVYSGGSGGRPGSGGGSSTITCTYTKAPPGVLERTGTGPPAPGYRWDIMTCPGSNPGSLGGHLVQVSIMSGTPAISPSDLMRIGIGVLIVPTLAAATAPPRGKDGLVGLPEWFWVPRSHWHDVSLTVDAGPVWATASAIPTAISFVPGAGLGSVSCPGPGTPFNRAWPATHQHTRCSYIYLRPSSGQPGSAYAAGLYVTWTVRWTGSGGVGGLITSGYTTGSAFAVRVAQAEALVTAP